MAATDISPNTDNYYSGKGILKFKRDGATEYRDLGDCPSFELTPNVSRLEHYSSRAGIRIKDQSLISQRQLSVRVIMDEVTASNLAMALLATPVDAVDLSATATLNSSTAVTSISPTTGLVVGETYAVASATGIPAGTSMVYNGGGAGTLSQAATATGSAHAITVTSPISFDIMADEEVKGALRFVGTNVAGAPLQVDLPSVTFAGGTAMNLIQENYGNIEVTGEVAANPTTGSFGKVRWNITEEVA